MKVTMLGHSAIAVGARTVLPIHEAVLSDVDKQLPAPSRWRIGGNIEILPTIWFLISQSGSWGAVQVRPLLGAGGVGCRAGLAYELGEVLVEVLEALGEASEVIHEPTHDVHRQREDDGGVLVSAKLQHGL